MTPTTRWPGSASAARNSSAKWSSTKTRIGSATSAGRKDFSSGSPKSWAEHESGDFSTARRTMIALLTGGSDADRVVSHVVEARARFIEERKEEYDADARRTVRRGG